MEVTVYNTEGSWHNTARMTVSEDGQILSTTITFPGGAANGNQLVMKHKRQPQAKLTSETVDTWCPNVRVADVLGQAGGPRAIPAISLSLDGLLPSAAALFRMFEESCHKGENSEWSSSVVDDVPGSDGVFTVTAKTLDGKSLLFEYKFKEQECACECRYTVDSKCLGVWYYNVLSQPIRLQCWNTMQDPRGMGFNVVSSIKNVQSVLDECLKAAQAAAPEGAARASSGPPAAAAPQTERLAVQHSASGTTGGGRGQGGRPRCCCFRRRGGERGQALLPR